MNKNNVTSKIIISTKTDIKSQKPPHFKCKEQWKRYICHNFLSEIHYYPLLPAMEDLKISRWDAPLESDLMNCQVSGPRLTGRHAIFQSRASLRSIVRE